MSSEGLTVIESAHYHTVYTVDKYSKSIKAAIFHIVLSDVKEAQ